MKRIKNGEGKSLVELTWKCPIWYLRSLFFRIMYIVLLGVYPRDLFDFFSDFRTAMEGVHRRCVCTSCIAGKHMDHYLIIKLRLHYVYEQTAFRRPLFTVDNARSETCTHLLYARAF